MTQENKNTAAEAALPPATCSACLGTGWIEVQPGQIRACDCKRQRLVRLRDAVAEAEPMLRIIEGMLASSLSSDSRSHDQDREPRRQINAILDALDELKPNKELSRAPKDASQGHE